MHDFDQLGDEQRGQNRCWIRERDQELRSWCPWAGASHVVAEGNVAPVSQPCCLLAEVTRWRLALEARRTAAASSQWWRPIQETVMGGRAESNSLVETLGQPLQREPRK